MTSSLKGTSARLNFLVYNYEGIYYNTTNRNQHLQLKDVNTVVRINYCIFNN